MAFAVICKSCQARFLLNDDLLKRRVAGKVITVRCRQCHAPIEVDASNIDPKALTEKAAPPAPEKEPAPTAAAASAFTPAVPRPAKAPAAPPRPTKSTTLMGIGAPAKVASAPELVALSPGLLNLQPKATASRTPHGFPEPPPPPESVETLSEGDWEVTETPALPKPTANAPESVDDFVEELPPSLPPPDEAPSSTGTPSLQQLTHHEQAETPKLPDTSFLSGLGSAQSAPAEDLAPPTIDVSWLTSPASAEAPPSIDISDFDLPNAGKQTLPLFGPSETLEQASAITKVPSGSAPTPPALLAAQNGSLSPAARDRPTPEAADARPRREVVAPGTTGAAASSAGASGEAPKRSALSWPILLALAAAAGFLIWKQRAAAPPPLAEHTEAATAAPQAAAPVVPTETSSVATPTQPVASVAAEPAVPDDMTFEAAPNAPAPVQTAAPTRAKPVDAPTETAAKPAAAPVPAKAAAASAEPAAPTQPAAPATAKEPSKPAAPSGPSTPAGPFDREAAAAALGAGAAQASSCKQPGDPSGVASVVITFAPSGRVTSANINGPPFAGTATGGCIAAALRKVHVPAFEGDRITVSKTIVIQ